MKYPFNLPYFPDETLVIEISKWTGRSKIWKEGAIYERSRDEGKPFLIPSGTGDVYRIYPKTALPDLVPALEINNIRYQIVERLPWYKYMLALLPMLLIFIGGGLGGGIGAFASLQNLHTFRTTRAEPVKYLMVVGLSLLAYLVYLLLGALIYNLIN